MFGEDFPQKIRNRVLGGVANGLTPDEILEAVLHSAPYIGLPATGQALASASGALEEA